LAVLTGENPDHEALIEVAWIAPSASYSGSSDFHTKGKWDLFQSKESNEKLISNGGKCLPFGYDANIQNETVADKNLGFWNKNGLYQVPPERTKAIFDQRRFICDTRALSLPPSTGSCKAPPAPSSCDDKSKPCFIRTVRVKPGQEGQSEAEIDYHDYGFYRREKPRQSAPISALHLRANNLGKLTQVARLRISVMVSGGFTRW
jgi:hypothetical protein